MLLTISTEKTLLEKVTEAQEILQRLWKPMVHYRARKSPPQDTIMNHLNLVHIFITPFPQEQFHLSFRTSNILRAFLIPPGCHLYMKRGALFKKLSEC
jgi:hypothetical protein